MESITQGRASKFVIFAKSVVTVVNRGGREIRSTYEILIGKLQGNGLLRRPKYRREIILKRIV
jgi:hypothetical protein